MTYLPFIVALRDHHGHHQLKLPEVTVSPVNKVKKSQKQKSKDTVVDRVQRQCTGDHEKKSRRDDSEKLKENKTSVHIHQKAPTSLLSLPPPLLTGLAFAQH